MDKVDQILDLLSERSGLLHDEYSTLMNGEEVDPVVEAELLIQIELINTLYKEVTLIKNED
jgi:hypothetical protein